MLTPITPDNLKENQFQTLFKDYLLAENGYTESSNQNFDKYHAIDTEMLFEFLENTQEKELANLEKIHGANYRKKIIQRLNKELARRSMIDILRHGIKDYGVELKFAYFKPPTTINKKLNRLYSENIFSVIEELNYKDDKRIDLVIFLNGLPIIVFELKNPVTGQTYKDAIQQLHNDRHPIEKLFKFKQRAIVSFAMDTEQAYMTTRLQDDDTYFLPFNKGKKGGAGNPKVDGKVKTHYIWEDILKKDQLLEILQKFVFIDEEEIRKENGEIDKIEKLIFPRYHQLDCIRQILDDVEYHKSGKKYLVQHSAGSGKTYSITWLAHRLSTLHDEHDDIIFDSVIVVTDRLVLDSQLQEKIYQMDHKTGVVQGIKKDSTQLADAIKTGTKIIVSTIQKFPYILETISGTEDKNYAIVIDEAHSSTTGKNMLALKESLSLEEAAQIDKHLQEESKDAEDKINEELEKLQNLEALSFFAFTATPKGSTLKMFGQENANGKPEAFHLYTMRQAIEEGFILDVLENYMTYNMYYQVNKKIKDDPEFETSKASREIARFVSLHPHNISQKTEIMVEHFRQNTKHKYNGNAKAMVVTSSRLHAVRYKKAFDKYIEENGYTDLNTLIAFSGTVKDKGLEHTENNMNEIRSSIRKEFDKQDYQLLLVANKFQTGFDQPKLHTMFVDKTLRGLNAVQTLSRLNRVYESKDDDTFVLDFVNDPEDIRKAFQPYYEATTLKSDIDPNDLYTMQDEIMATHLINIDDVDEFVEIYYKDVSDHRDNQLMNNYLDNAIERIEKLDEEEKIEFRNKIKRFYNLYMLILQIAPIKDVELHKLSIYLRYLRKKIEVGTTEKIDVSDKVELGNYELKKNTDGGIVLDERDDYEVDLDVSGGGTTKQKDKDPLSVIIERLNERFGTDFSEKSKIAIRQMQTGLQQDDDLKKRANSNTLEDFKFAFQKKFDDIAIESYDENTDFYGKVLKDEEFKSKLMDMMLMGVYQSLKE